MLDALRQFFASSSFIPHGYCFTWTPSLLWSMVGADSVIALAYYSIPLALVVLVRKRRDLSFNWIVLLFSAFIFACGTSHLLAIWTIWHPDYWLEALVKTTTASVSIVTAFMLWPLIPKAVRLPSVGDLSAAVTRLEAEAAERRKAEAALAEANAQLVARVAEAEAANHAKSEFLSRMSHELRTPLNAVLGFTQLSAQALDAGESVTVRGYLRHVEDAGWHLRNLINDVLDLSRIEKGQPQIDVTEIDLPAALNHVRALVQTQQGEHRVSVNFDVPPDLPVLRADRTRLVQVLTNLVSNAIKFNRPGGEVRVVARRDERGALALQVIDNGIGMTPEQQAGLFEPFNRLGRERLGIPGTGIGLVLVRHLVELMGGSIQVASDADRGTTVSLRFASTAAAA